MRRQPANQPATKRTVHKVALDERAHALHAETARVLVGASDLVLVVVDTSHVDLGEASNLAGRATNAACRCARE